nr:MAG TPA: hypothetical protein [Caudoviricetes sp.]
MPRPAVAGPAQPGSSASKEVYKFTLLLIVMVGVSGRSDGSYSVTDLHG